MVHNGIEYGIMAAYAESQPFLATITIATDLANFNIRYMLKLQLTIELCDGHMLAPKLNIAS
jgi:hypothetical protein